MRLRKLKLKNFRGYRNSTEIIIDESMTGIVGRNDFGKSTLLEALAIFFETEGMKADKNDMNCFSLREGDGRFEIACEFDDLPDFIMIDDRVQTTLASEHLLNEDGNFEIVKTFKATTSGKPEQTCIRCIHPDEEPLRNLLGMKISELKAVGKEVEKNVAGTPRNVIYAIEEPETSQHPNYQMMLMKALLALAGQPHRQIIVTTHVPALAGLIPVEGVRYVTRNEAGEPVVKMPDDAVLKEATESLGVLPETGMERAQGIVLVEGKSDVTFLRHAASSLKQSGALPASLEDVKIVPVLIGGCGSVKHWVTLNLAKDLGLPWCVFLDSDIGGDPAQVLSIQKRKKEVEEAGKVFFATRKREIENYLCPDLIEEITGVAVTFTDTCDAKKIIGRAVGMKPDNVLDKFWPQMTSERIISRSTYHDGTQERSELVEILSDIVSMTR
ncbi:AAA family ATPase [Salmonella enterica subsp. enterica serovar 4,[5],12:i:-]|nr:AAA family ATPase [Salmonella enterica subsp. enterica serovar 4,[5],12:i:-]EFH2560358.1 AAA family ATPase [Escherichia coli]EFJ1806419.1 AAA family ATPase [Escherichia coli]